MVRCAPLPRVPPPLGWKKARRVCVGGGSGRGQESFPNTGLGESNGPDTSLTAKAALGILVALWEAAYWAGVS
jgi:hypothetical protein